MYNAVHSNKELSTLYLGNIFHLKYSDYLDVNEVNIPQPRKIGKY